MSGFGETDESKCPAVEMFRKHNSADVGHKIFDLISYRLRKVMKGNGHAAVMFHFGNSA